MMPVLAWLGYWCRGLVESHIYSLLLGILLVGSVLAAVYHAEVIAFRWANHLAHFYWLWQSPLLK